ncbi:hypothetical protein RCL_jg17596.t1 [Rhizophagus clarus]|uniref:Uncharacterized protein n=1 Tax=Rhizophagus clarus TaxID=94130 RepID=A0A8H3QLB2_9GLOM|nr:hypothetical protein RCL_jg17596.t1 [Rhizophagus clarus]
MLLTSYIINPIIAIDSYGMMPFYESLDINVCRRTSIYIPISEDYTVKKNSYFCRDCVLGFVINELFLQLEYELVGKLYLPKSSDFDMNNWKQGIKLGNWQSRITMTLVGKEYKNKND